MSEKIYYKYKYHGPIKVKGRLVEVEYKREVFATSKEMAFIFIRKEWMDRYGLYNGEEDACVIDRNRIKKVSNMGYSEEEISDFPRILKALLKEK